MRRLVRSLGVLSLVLTLALLSLGVHAWFVWSPGAPTYVLAAERAEAPLAEHLRDGAEHDRVNAPHPEHYGLALEPARGALLYYGAHHDDDPASPQLVDIRRRWAEFRPTVALCEGRARGYLLGPLFPLLTGVPEPAQVHALARADGVPLYSLEPDYADEVLYLLRRFEPADIALFFTLRVYWSETRGEPDEALAEELRAKRCDVDGLHTALPDLAAMDEAWRCIVSESDWRVGPADGSVEAMPGILREIGEASVARRGEHMTRVLIELVERGERVFAVVGSGHVIRQEWALRSALGAEPASDQPLRR